ncbi:MAG: phytoene/squalene synthase family protein [Myxococcales bacterium]|nr:phytoene/squalene synthase family protein [Myxococcales bacterium]
MTEAALIATGRADLVACREVIAQHSRSFALASTLLGPTARDHAAALYAWCRAADDAVDLAAPGQQGAALAGERAELARIYDGAPLTLAGRALAAMARARAIPIVYPTALLDGMAMDVDDVRYQTHAQLFTYCYRVASVVGLMMCHVLGVSDDRALVPAAHLGVAMQLTNIARDVGEDWGRGRLYLPDELLAQHRLGGLADRLGQPLPADVHADLHAAQRALLVVADRYYRSAASGYRALPGRASAAIRTAARVYRAIGAQVRRLGPAAITTRAVVGGGRKAGHVAAALTGALGATPTRLVDRVRGRRPRVPSSVLELADVPRL